MNVYIVHVYVDTMVNTIVANSHIAENQFWTNCRNSFTPFFRKKFRKWCFSTKCQFLINSQKSPSNLKMQFMNFCYSQSLPKLNFRHFCLRLIFWFLHFRVTAHFLFSIDFPSSIFEIFKGHHHSRHTPSKPVCFFFFSHFQN